MIENVPKELAPFQDGFQLKEFVNANRFREIIREMEDLGYRYTGERTFRKVKA